MYKIIGNITLFVGMSLGGVIFNYYEFINRVKKENEFRKRMLDINKLEEESYMTRELAADIIEAWD